MAIRSWFRQFIIDLEAPPSGERFRLWMWVIFPLLALAGLTAFARLTNFDLAAQTALYQAAGESWAFGDHPFWKWLYDFGTIPTSLAVLGAVAGYVLSFSKDRFRKWRRVFVFIVLTAVVGPGVITNGMLKEYWGRPRPREVENLGGHSRFEPVLSIDLTSKGKSFPCGHATMGFIFYAGYFLLRRHRRGLAEWFFWGGLISGTLLGIARMAQGAHFFSDVVWASTVCWFTAMGLYFLLRLDHGLIRRGLPRKAMPWWLRIVVATVVVGGITTVMLASPYRDVRNLYVVNDFAKEGPLEVRLILTLGEVEIVGGEDFHITGEAWGHGVPTSRIALYYVENERPDYSEIVYAERISGWFAEVEEQIEVMIPPERTRAVRIDTGESELWIDLEGIVPGTLFDLRNGAADVVIERADEPLQIIGGENAAIAGLDLSEEGGAVLKLGSEFTGSVRIETKSSE